MKNTDKLNIMWVKPWTQGATFNRKLDANHLFALVYSEALKGDPKTMIVWNERGKLLLLVTTVFTASQRSEFEEMFVDAEKQVAGR